MDCVGIAKLIDGNNIGYRLVTEKGISVYEAEQLRRLLNAKRIKIQNMGEVRDKNSALGALTVDFTVGHDYPIIYKANFRNELENRANKLTMLGYENTKNGKIFTVCDKEGNMFNISNVEVRALEELDLITNASYCKNGTVKLDAGTMQEVSEEIKRFTRTKDSNFVNNYVTELIKAEHRRLSNTKREPDFAKLDKLEQTLPDQLKRKEAYYKMSETYARDGQVEASFRDSLETAGMFGLGALAFGLDCATFAGKMRLGNAILDGIFGKK